MERQRKVKREVKEKGGDVDELELRAEKRGQDKEKGM